MGFLEQEGFESLKRKAQRYVRDIANDVIDKINEHTTKELENRMATINESLDRLSGAISTEIQQVRDELQAVIDDLGEENADLRAQLEGQVAQLDSAIARVDSMSTDLEANDPEAPVEPAPEV
jgi:division protein CdvB (Snf7/Vps24/ESCRT-III family)